MQRANASLLIGTSSWKEQFVEALTVSSSGEDEDEKEPSGLDYCMHFVTLFWKILFAFVPPTGKNFNSKHTYRLFYIAFYFFYISKNMYPHIIVSPYMIFFIEALHKSSTVVPRVLIRVRLCSPPPPIKDS